MFPENQSMPMPMGMKATPMTKKVGRMVPAVRMGCQAGRRCCLKALSGKQIHGKMRIVASSFTLQTSPAGFFSSFFSLPVPLLLVGWCASMWVSAKDMMGKLYALGCGL